MRKVVVWFVVVDLPNPRIHSDASVNSVALIQQLLALTERYKIN